MNADWMIVTETDAEIMTYVINGQRPPPELVTLGSSDLTQFARSSIEDSWAQEPERRPSFAGLMFYSLDKWVLDAHSGQWFIIIIVLKKIVHEVHLTN